MNNKSDVQNGELVLARSYGNVQQRQQNENVLVVLYRWVSNAIVQKKGNWDRLMNMGNMANDSSLTLNHKVKTIYSIYLVEGEAGIDFGRKMLSTPTLHLP